MTHGEVMLMNMDLEFAFIDGGALPLKQKSRRFWLVPSLTSLLKPDVEIIPSPHPAPEPQPCLN